MAEFGARLRELRTIRKMRQKDLADAVGLAQTTIANYEQGTRFPDQERLNKLADHFDVSLDYLLGRERDNSSSHGNNASMEKYPDTVEYVNGLLTGNFDSVASRLITAVTSGVDPRVIYLKVLQPALELTGNQWEQGKITVAQEHYMTSLTKRLMSQLVVHATRKEKQHHTLLAVCAHGELHDTGLQMICDFMELEGWNCYFLGCNTPTRDIIEAVLAYHASVVAISVTMKFHLDSLEHLIDALHKASPTCKIVVGGRAFDNDKDLWQSIGADGYAEDAERAVQLINQLIKPKSTQG